MRANMGEKEIKKIYEKSIRLLDNSQSQLRHLRQILKKTVIRLSALHHSDNKRIDEILDAVSQSVNNKLDLVELDGFLDDLFVLTNQDDYKNTAANKTFNVYLKAAIEAGTHKELLAAYRYELDRIVNGDLPDEKSSIEVLDLFDMVAGEARKYKSESAEQLESVTMFAQKVSESISYELDPDSESIDEILGGLSHALIPYLNQQASDTEIKTVDAANIDDVNLNQMLIEFVSQLSLQEDIKPKRNALTRELSYPVVGFSAWNKVISDMVDVINGSITLLDEEKQELQGFIAKIINKLTDIEAYVQSTKNSSAETLDQSAELAQSVNAEVQLIENSVSGADDIETLKKNVQGHLNSIRHSVEENNKVLEDKEIQSKKSYSNMMNELSTTQRESERLKEQLEESHYQLLRDDLTGLPNRMAFTERMNSEYHRWKRNGTPLCVAMWDIDKFKNFNDKYGHDIGDRVLKIVSNLIHTRIRNVDMFARYGGEEFVLLMPDTELAPALSLCDSLRVKLSEADFHYNGDTCMITSSVGIASFREGDSIDEVMKRADIALYQSKDSGRNCCTADGL